MKEDFINELVTLFVKNYPLDDKGYVHVQMKRLEIEACREKLGLSGEMRITGRNKSVSQR